MKRLKQLICRCSVSWCFRPVCALDVRGRCLGHFTKMGTGVDFLRFTQSMERALKKIEGGR